MHLHLMRAKISTATPEMHCAKLMMYDTKHHRDLRKEVEDAWELIFKGPEANTLTRRSKRIKTRSKTEQHIENIQIKIHKDAEKNLL